MRRYTSYSCSPVKCCSNCSWFLPRWVIFNMSKDSWSRCTHSACTIRWEFNSCPGCKSFCLTPKRLLSDRYQLAFHRVNTIFVPIMVSRLMLSLKKAAVGSAATWSLATLTDFGRGTSLGTIHFASRAPGGSREALETPTLPNGGDIELEPMPRLPRDRGS